MRSFRSCLTFMSFLSVCLRGKTEEQYAKECTVFDTVSQQLDQEPLVSMSCNKNTECTGFDCSGKYNYDGLYALGEKLEIDYCFGMNLHPCPPIGLHFYIDLPKQHAHYQHTINGTTDVEIPGLKYELGELGSAHGYMAVNMTRRVIGGKNYVLVGIRFKVRIQGPVSAMGEWPEALQRQFMPNTLVPLPPCNQDIITPTNNPKTCAPYTAKSTQQPKVSTIPEGRTTVAMGSSTSHPSPTPGGSIPWSPSSVGPTNASSPDQTTIPTTPSEGYTGVNCKYGPAAYQCANNELCDQHNHCVCILGYIYNPNTSRCEASNQPATPDKPILIPDPYDGPIVVDGGTKGINPLVIGLSVAGVALLVICAVGAFMFVRYKKHQLRYGQHELLPNNEEDDDDDPIAA